MTVATEPINEVKIALYGRLNGDATLTALLSGGIVEDGKQANKALPLVTYQRQGGSALYVLGGVNHWRYIFAVKGITEGSSSKVAGQISARVSTLLLAATPLTFQGADPVELMPGGVAWLSPIDFTETSDGKVFSHIGAVYEINCREAS